MKPGIEVFLKKPFWHHGQDLGGRIGLVLSISGYVMVDIYDYNDNPVKCFKHDIEVVKYEEYEDMIQQLEFELIDLEDTI